MQVDEKQTSTMRNESLYSSVIGNRPALDFKKCENKGDINQCRANRFCTRCKMYICADCALDSHFDHISEAQSKIEDFMSKVKDELSNSLLKVDLRLNNSKFMKMGVECSARYKKMVEENINADEKVLQNIRSKIDGILESLQRTKKHYFSLIDQNTDKISNNPVYKKINRDRKATQDLVSSWSSLSFDEKDSLYKRKAQWELEILRDIESLDKDTFSTSNNSYSEGIESMVKELNSKIIKNNFLREEEIRYVHYQSDINKFMNTLDKLEFPIPTGNHGENEKEMSEGEDLNKMRVDTLPATRMDIPMTIPTPNPGPAQNLNNFSSSIPALSPGPKSNGKISILTSEIDHIINPIPVTSPPRNPYTHLSSTGFQKAPPQQDPIPRSKSSIKEKELDYLITIKTKPDNKSESWVLFTDLKKDPESTIKIKLEEQCFEGCKGMSSFPPEFSKSINIGSSLLISGGQEQGKQIDSCYMLKVLLDKTYVGYRVVVTKFTSLNTKRERHNLIFLRDRNSVVVCGGFYTKTTEILELDRGSNSLWTPLPLMRNERTNATMLYFNNRYVYCIGGYEMNKENKSNPGIYLGSCELLDMDCPTQWNYINLNAIFNINLGLCAMGCVEFSPSKFLLVGGFDGNKYLNEGHELTYENEKITSIKNVKLTGLGKGAIFYHTRFIPVVENKFVNYDMGGKLFTFDADKNLFSFKQNNL